MLSVPSWAVSGDLWPLPLVARRVFNPRPKPLYRWARASDQRSLSSTVASAPIPTAFEAPWPVSCLYLTCEVILSILVAVIFLPGLFPVGRQGFGGS